MKKIIVIVMLTVTVFIGLNVISGVAYIAWSIFKTVGASGVLTHLGITFAVAVSVSTIVAYFSDL